MKRVLAAIAILASGTASAADRLTSIPEPGFVSVRNLAPVRNQNAKFDFGDRCFTERGDAIRAIGSDNGDVLVQIVTVSGSPAGRRCPRGTQFFVPADRFEKMTAEYLSSVRIVEDERSRVRRITGE